MCTLPVTYLHSRSHEFEEKSVRLNDHQVTIPRPGVCRFVEDLAGIAEVAILTAADLDYALRVIEKIELDGLISRIFSIRIEGKDTVHDRMDLDARSFVHVDDLQPDDELMVVKLATLGIASGDRERVDRCFVHIEPYLPHLYGLDDHHLGPTEERVVRKLKRQGRPLI